MGVSGEKPVKQDVYDKTLGVSSEIGVNTNKSRGINISWDNSNISNQLRKKTIKKIRC